MKFPQLLTIVGLLCLGGLLSNVRDAVEPQAVAMSASTAQDIEFDPIKHVIDGHLKRHPETCDCGPDCKCHDQCKSKLSELQAKYDAMLAEKTQAASFKASTGNGSTGDGGSTGRHPVANTVKGAAVVAGKTVQAASNVVKGTIHTAAKVATAPVANYRARWTYPGTIEHHMATSHGVSVSGMSQSELLSQHDALHDLMGPVYQSQNVSYSSSSCPGGVCPSSRTATASRPGLLGRILRR